MDREKGVRGPLGARVTRTINETELELAKEAPDMDLLQTVLLKIEDSSLSRLQHPMNAQMKSCRQKVMPLRIMITSLEG
jgi:hypothetical protein